MPGRTPHPSRVAFGHPAITGDPGAPPCHQSHASSPDNATPESPTYRKCGVSTMFSGFASQWLANPFLWHFRSRRLPNPANGSWWISPNTITWAGRTTAFSWVSGRYGSGGFTLSKPATNDSPGGSYSGRSPGPCLSGCPICPLCVRFSGRGDEAYDANVMHFGGGAGDPLYR